MVALVRQGVSLRQTARRFGVSLLTVQRWVQRAQGGRARYERESERGGTVPRMSAGQVLQVSHGGDVILAGKSYAE